MFHKDLHGQDLHDAKAHVGVGSPIGVFAADVVGLQYFDSVGLSLYVSTGLTASDWVLITTASDPYISVQFTYATATPLDFGALGAGDVIIDADLVIETPFDDPSAMLALGRVSAPGTILPISAIDPSTASTYNAGEDFVVGGVDALRLQITPGASTQGAGRVIVTVRRAP